MACWCGRSLEESKISINSFFFPIWFFTYLFDWVHNFSFFSFFIWELLLHKRAMVLRYVQCKSPSLLSHVPIIYHGFWHQSNPPKNLNHMLAHITLSLCHCCDVDFVLFHNVTCYTNSLLSCIHINTTCLLNSTYTLACHMLDSREVMDDWNLNEIMPIIEKWIWRFGTFYILIFMQWDIVMKVRGLVEESLSKWQ